MLIVLVGHRGLGWPMAWIPRKGLLSVRRRIVAVTPGLVPAAEQHAGQVFRRT
jgi:hypothetical protein